MSWPFSRSASSYDVLQDDSASSSQEKEQTHAPKFSRWLAAACVASTLVNILLFLHLPSLPEQSVLPTFSRADIHKLRRPSQYIHLDEVPRPSPPVPLHFDNFPIVIAPVDSTQKDKIYNDDPRRYMAHTGTVSLEDRRVLVTSTVSTVVQFRAIDYGMELCEVHIDLPLLLPNSTSYAGHGVIVSLYRLAASVPVNTKTLSYRTRPQRLAKLADISLQAGNISRWSHRLSCASEEVFSFELARPDFDDDFDCHVEWWQDRSGTGGGPGIYITQYATV